MPIKSFRASIANDTIDTIPLSTRDGSTGYRIRKFQVMGPDGNTNIEHVIKIYKVPQTAAGTGIDFSDQTLLAAAVFNDVADPHYLAGSVIFFDNETFNQDLYVTSLGHDNTGLMNYYIELEQVRLDLSANTVATLKDIRNIEAQGLT
jgi:hypothetical protein